MDEVIYWNAYVSAETPLVSCGECGALLLEMKEDEHRAWHASVAPTDLALALDVIEAAKRFKSDCEALRKGNAAAELFAAVDAFEEAP